MKNTTKILIAFYVFAVILRLIFAFQTSTFTGDEAYYEIRQIESIRETGSPIINDELSYGGRTNFFLPIFNYIMAIFSLVLTPALAAKIMPNIFAALIVFPVYLLAKHITRDNRASLMAAFISIFIPIFTMITLNGVSRETLFIPIFFYMIYCFMHIRDDEKYVNQYIILLFATLLIEPFVIILVPAFVIYYLISKAEKKHIKMAYLEIMLFTLIATIWVDFILFKKAFLTHGAWIIRENLPTAIVSQHFGQINILTAISQIGILPLILGLVVIYRNTFEHRKKSIFFFTSLALVIFLLLLTRLVELDIGLIFLGIILTILSSQFFSKFFEFNETSRVSKHSKLFLTLFIIAILLTSAIPTLVFMNHSIKNSVPEQEIEVMRWIEENTKNDSVILGTLEQGHLITALAKRKNVIDSNFMLIKEPEKRINEVDRIYSSVSKTNAVRLLNKYEVDYILFSDYARKQYNITELDYATPDCFEITRVNETIIYRSKCEVQN